MGHDTRRDRRLVPGGDRLNHEVCGIVLAAGAGTRFGGAKQLAPLAGKPLLQHVLDAVGAARELDRLVLVLGACAEEVRAAVDARAVELVVCSDWQAGLSASLRAGLGAAAGADWALIVLGDEPGLPAAAIDRVAAAARTAAPATTGVRACWNGRPGHPVALASVVMQKAVTLRGDVGARALLNHATTLHVECGDLGEVADVDTPSDLEALAACLTLGGVRRRVGGMTARFDGRVAVVTGAAAGLGRAYACHLAANGAAVAIADVADASETVAVIEAAGGTSWTLTCDITDPESVAAFARAVHARQARCDILVNNAGIYPVVPFEEMTFETWRRVMAVNLDGMFLMCQAFLPGMRERHYGRVVNITTTIPWLTVPDFSAYSASKMGVIGLTRALASEYGQHGVTVNAAAPSLVRTATTEAGPQAQMFEAVAQIQAIKRTQEPEDMVGTVAFLCSDDAAFMTGQTLITDGGLTRV